MSINNTGGVIAIATLLIVMDSAVAQPQDNNIPNLLIQATTRLANIQSSDPGPHIDLTLGEAIARALERNLDLAVQRLNPQVFDLNLAQQLSAYRPSVNSSVSNSSRTNPASTQLDGGNSVISDVAIFNSACRPRSAIPYLI